jgi:hypothetical protein
MKIVIYGDSYEIKETEQEYIYTLTDKDIEKVIIKGSLRDCVEKAKEILEDIIYENL